jgi:hypothetical protein
MRCDVDPDKVSAGQPNDDEDIEQIEANGRDNEQVHGGDVRRVVTQEGAPSLGRRSTSLDHVLRDAGLKGKEGTKRPRVRPAGSFSVRGQFAGHTTIASEGYQGAGEVPTNALEPKTLEFLGWRGPAKAIKTIKKVSL